RRALDCRRRRRQINDVDGEPSTVDVDDAKSTTDAGAPSEPPSASAAVEDEDDDALAAALAELSQEATAVPRQESPEVDEPLSMDDALAALASEMSAIDRQSPSATTAHEPTGVGETNSPDEAATPDHDEPVSIEDALASLVDEVASVQRQTTPGESVADAAAEQEADLPTGDASFDFDDLEAMDIDAESLDLLRNVREMIESCPAVHAEDDSDAPAAEAAPQNDYALSTP
ncbi:MAG: hypothetical protein KDA41_04535, partial [Planctomycetales bacterium]|nr:hypothetical protein [Planctomycetales bacterium]